MVTSVAGQTTRPGARFIPPYWVFIGLITGAMMECVGAYWDVWFHVHEGRDTFWTIPHIILYSGAVTLGVFGGIGGVKALKALRADLKSLGRKFTPLMSFAVPFGYIIVVVGISVQIASGPFDDAWHVRLLAEKQPDVFYTPPHLMATFGGVFAFAGVLVEAVRCQRLTLGVGYAAGGFRDPNLINRYDIFIALSIGAFWLGLTFIATPLDFPRGWVTLRGAAVQGLALGIAGILASRLLRFPGAFLIAGAPFIVIHSIARDGPLFIPAFLGAVACFDLLGYQLEIKKYVSPTALAAIVSGLLLGALLFLTPLPKGQFVAWPEMATVAGMSLVDMYALETQGVAQIAIAMFACAGAALIGSLFGAFATKKMENGNAIPSSPPLVKA